ncbi:MAG: NUDIX hydrolase [Lachnospiraceae bacterium]
MIELKRLKRELIFKGSIVDFYKDTIEMPNGNIVKWDHLAHRGAVAIVPVLSDGRIVLVRQHRNSIDRIIWEIPAGGVEASQESALEAARRELLEEAGYDSKRLEHLLTIHTAVAFSDEVIEIYVAFDMIEGEQHLDENEFLEVAFFTYEEIKTMIFDGRITDSKTISAILAYGDKYL